VTAVQRPSWFTDERYSFIPGLDAREWLSQLNRANFFANPSWPEKYDDWRGPLGFKELGEEFDPDIQTLNHYLGPPVVQALEAPHLADMHLIELPALLLKVSLSAPDAVIIQEFKKILSAVRERCPAPVKKRGPQALNGYFDEQHFSKWRKHKILELADLLGFKAFLAWKAKKETGENIKIPSDAELGRWLGFGDKKKKELALAVLREALHSIPALAAQVTSEAAAKAKQQSLRR
jgi:hypothetical protein